jgi:DNA-binding MarR family transcriptional regulator
MTRLVDRLERDGLLERDKCSSDARGYFAVLTPKGEELLVTARRTHLDGVRERFVQHFAPEELATLARWWDRLTPGAEDLSQLD